MTHDRQAPATGAPALRLEVLGLGLWTAAFPDWPRARAAWRGEGAGPRAAPGRTGSFRDTRR